MSGLELIVAERARQVSVEGWTPEHDDQHVRCELNEAARCYAREAVAQVRAHVLPGAKHGLWPWDAAWWKPSDDPVRNLVKAGALLAAEIDRLQRLVEKGDS